MFEFKRSELEFIHFSIMESEIFLPPPPDDFDQDQATELFELYKVMGDFWVLKDEEQPKYFRVFINLAINENKSIPGYNIKCGGVGLFKLNNKSTDHEEVIQLVNSAVSFSFNYIRNFISDSTAHYALGSYTMPIFDLGALLDAKANRELNQSKKRQIKKPTPPKTAKKKK